MCVHQLWSKTAKVGRGGGTGVRSPPREGEGEIAGEESKRWSSERGECSFGAIVNDVKKQNN